MTTQTHTVSIDGKRCRRCGVELPEGPWQVNQRLTVQTLSPHLQKAFYTVKEPDCTPSQPVAAVLACRIDSPAPAFPMSLRDWLAGQALPACIHNGERANEVPDSGEDITIPDVAREAYRFADAVLAERAKGETK